MITHHTVLILGAGASKPYGLFLGGELRDRLCYEIGDAPWQQMLREHGLAETPDINAFSQAFLRSGLASIDKFLANRPTFSKIGKLAIAACLCRKEREELIYKSGIEDNWYPLLWDAMVTNVREPNGLLRNQIAIVTFNYDRSLEFFLHEATKATYGVNDAQALAACSKLSIKHVYGMLGRFHYENAPGVRTYAAALDRSLLETAADAIRIIPEAERGDEVFRDVKEILEGAENICFLGFGFDSLNMQRLGLGKIIEARKARGSPPTVCATVVGKVSPEVGDIHRDLGGPPDWRINDQNNSLALRNFGVLR